MRVDNAASCVIACVNPQRRDIAFKRAAEVLAWREVIKQLTDDTEDELKEARGKQDEAVDKLRRDIERLFRRIVGRYRNSMTVEIGLHPEPFPVPVDEPGQRGGRGSISLARKALASVRISLV
jgi:hypothetical protein